MQPSLRIKQSGTTWNLSGNTVVNEMNDTEMLFRIVQMTNDECFEFANSLSKEELHNIVLKIQEHRLEKQKAEGLSQDGTDMSVSVTNFVVQKHISNKGWN